MSNDPPQLWLRYPHGPIRAAYNIPAGPWYKLRHPPKAANKEAAIDEEENQGWVAARVLPVNDECQLNTPKECNNNNVGLTVTFKV